MVTWAMVLETAIKWLIPMICVAIVGLLTAYLVKPFKKGNSAQRQEDWDSHFLASHEPKKMGDKELEQFKTEIKKTVTEADQEILKQIGELSSNIKLQNESNKVYHDKVDKSIGLIQQGVQDAHLQNLIATCQIYIKRGYITTAEFETYQSRYQLYKDLGGNGHMEPWNAKICALPNEPPKPTTDTRSGTITQLPIPKTHV